MGYFLQFRYQIAAATRKMFALGPGGNKPVISDVLTRKIEGTSWLVVYGQARVVALGKPSGSGTFGDVADTFFCRICTLK